MAPFRRALVVPQHIADKAFPAVPLEPGWRLVGLRPVVVARKALAAVADVAEVVGEFLLLEVAVPLLALRVVPVQEVGERP